MLNLDCLAQGVIKYDKEYVEKYRAPKTLLKRHSPLRK
jgi:hypothetical protein